MSAVTVFWVDNPERERRVLRFCKRCRASEENFDIVRPAGTAHLPRDLGGWHSDGFTACGIDASGFDWWWRE